MNEYVLFTPYGKRAIVFADRTSAYVIAALFGVEVYDVNGNVVYVPDSPAKEAA